MKTWKKLEEKSHDYWLEMVLDDGSKIYANGNKKGVPLYTTTASCKFDGCIHLYRYFNGYSYDHECESEDCLCLKEYTHICDIDGFIETLELLKKEAVAYFGDDWSKNQ